MNNYIEINGHRFWYLENDIQISYTYDVEWINDQLCIKGKLIHREDGPAIESAYGDKEYLQYGKYHRIGGPAVEHTNGYKSYLENGKLHREDGPARELSNGRIEYWLDGRQILVNSQEEFEEFVNYLLILI